MNPPYDLVVRGTLIDPANHIYGLRDIGISDGRIQAVEPCLDQYPRREFLDASDRYVSPGFIDIHAHVYAGVTSWGVKPDAPCIRSGVTTVVDAGSAGWPMLQGFRWYISDPAVVRVLCFLHISGIGLVNAWVNECEDIRHLEPQTVGENVAENRDLVVGIKVRQGLQQVGAHGVEPLRLAIRAAEVASTPLMCHIAAGIPLPSVLELLRPGDIVTHCFQGRGGEVENLTDARGKLLPEVVDARSKGVVMDVGHGGGSFMWKIAEAALENGFFPDVISSDLHAYNLHGPLYDLATCVTKFLYLGMSLEQTIECVTTAPARAIGRPDLGTLSPGGPADLAVFKIESDPIELSDTHGDVRKWDRKLQVTETIISGTIYRPNSFEHETREEITRRCRVRGV